MDHVIAKAPPLINSTVYWQEVDQHAVVENIFSNNIETCFPKRTVWGHLVTCHTFSPRKGEKLVVQLGFVFI